MRRFFGYSVSNPFLGWVNLDDPYQLLLEEGERVKTDLY
jgi:hypothetical protein